MPNKLDEESKERFLKIFGNKDIFLSIRKSCKKTEIGKSTVYRWILSDPEFAKKVDKIKKRQRKDWLRRIKKGSKMAQLDFLGSLMKGSRSYFSIDQTIKRNKEAFRVMRKVDKNADAFR